MRLKKDRILPSMLDPLRCNIDDLTRLISIEQNPRKRIAIHNTRTLFIRQLRIMECSN